MVSMLTFCCMVLSTVASAPATSQAAKASTHDWKYIAYPSLPTLLDDPPMWGLRIENRQKDGLALVLSCSVPMGEGGRLRELPPAQKTGVRLHLPDGEIIEPDPDKRTGAELGRGRAETKIYIYRFRWARNVMEEAWIELHLSGQVYWVEVPYGFTRDPADPTLPLGIGRGPPSVAPAMDGLGPRDRIVPWQHVRYDLGRVQNNWRLSLNVANPFDAQAEVVIYRDDIEIGKSMYLWDLHSPRTAIEIEQDGKVLSSRGMSIRLHEDGLRRSDTFKFNRNPGSHSRDWGTVRIRVDDTNYECIVPSSLFKYVHGIADPYSRALVPRESRPAFQDE